MRKCQSFALAGGSFCPALSVNENHTHFLTEHSRLCISNSFQIPNGVFYFDHDALWSVLNGRLFHRDVRSLSLRLQSVCHPHSR